MSIAIFLFALFFLSALRPVKGAEIKNSPMLLNSVSATSSYSPYWRTSRFCANTSKKCGCFLPSSHSRIVSQGDNCRGVSRRSGSFHVSPRLSHFGSDEEHAFRWDFSRVVESENPAAGRETQSPGRRDFLRHGLVLAPSFLWSTQQHSAFASETTEGVGLLDSRVTENSLSPPPYSLDGTDVFYPSYFSGVWQVTSKTTDVQAPCGAALFGGNATLASARKEVGGPDLSYKARFLPVSNNNGASIADRGYNVAEIAKAAMGVNAVVDVSEAKPNKFSCLLLPSGAGTMFQVDIITIARLQQSVDEFQFHCGEVVRQLVAPANAARPTVSMGGSSSNGPNRPPRPLLKEIETISLYTAVPSNKGVNTIRCRQRSATFLLPSQEDPVAYQMWEATRGRPIDVRFYDVTYTKQ